MRGSDYFRDAQKELEALGEDNSDYKVVVLRALTNIYSECSAQGTSNNRIVAFMDLVIDYLHELL